MSLSRSYISFLALMAMGTVATALKINTYSDNNCQNFIGSYYPGDCDQVPGGINSWYIECHNNFDDNCEAIQFYNSNSGGCADQHAVGALGCSCNADPTSNDNRRCQTSGALHAYYWALRGIDSRKPPILQYQQ
ncbi:hypothetical protein J3F84DRAFT_404607 [Trichoderma pleuroticola]